MEVAMQKRFDDYTSSFETAIGVLSPRASVQSPLAASPQLSRLELPNWGNRGPLLSQMPAWAVFGLGAPLIVDACWCMW